MKIEKVLPNYYYSDKNRIVTEKIEYIISAIYNFLKKRSDKLSFGLGKRRKGKKERSVNFSTRRIFVFSAIH